MIVYNVTCSMDEALADEWLRWMKTEHLPEVMATGCFLEYRILKLLTSVVDDNGVNYAIQYTADSMDKIVEYREKHGPGLQQKTLEKYGESVLAFRTLMEVISQ